MSRYRRRVPKGLRRELFLKTGGRCPRCDREITEATCHLAHLRAASHGGSTIRENLEAWCAPCNLANGTQDVCDPRWPLRPWQQEALPTILGELTFERVATLMAAPGAGKTLFTGAVFAMGQEAGLWERLLVVVPRVPLVKQWARTLTVQAHIDLDITPGARGCGRELRDMDGVVTTYQGLLSQAVRDRYRDAVEAMPTLVALDEVHHLGESAHEGIDDGAAWANACKDLLGDLRTGIRVAGVLNLSGTLFRTHPRERIATIKYVDSGNDRIQSVADYQIHAEQLVREGLLRAPDLFRVGATVDIVDLRTAEVITSPIADLTDEGPRVALSQLNRRPEWIAELVKATLDQLEKRYRDSKGAPVKALIVAHRQDMARSFAQEVDRQMARRGLQPLAECVVSDDGPDAYQRLDHFRLSKRPGVLCTVGMAGEGYDCADICVVTYATNVLTAQYVRQVVARGQRVTDWERQKVGHPLPTAIILPDVPQLVKFFTDILAPMVHDLEVPTGPPPARPGPAAGGPSQSGPTRELVDVRDAELDIVSAVSTDGAIDVNPLLQDLLVPILQKVNLAESLWPRVGAAMEEVDRQRPFDAPLMGRTAAADRPAADHRPLTAREHQGVYRRKVARARGWWAQKAAAQGEMPVAYFHTRLTDAAGIHQFDTATPDQMARAWHEAQRLIMEFCRGSGTPLPAWWHDEGGDAS